MTNSEQHFSWNDYGLSLSIPENSLPVNLQQCSLHITASIVGDYQLPHDTHLVSTVFWIECVPKCHFSQPLVLEIEHCAKPENVSKLQFIKAGLKEENIVFHPISNPFETKFSKKNSSGLRGSYTQKYKKFQFLVFFCLLHCNMYQNAALQYKTLRL